MTHQENTLKRGFDARTICKGVLIKLDTVRFYAWRTSPIVDSDFNL